MHLANEILTFQKAPKANYAINYGQEKKKRWKRTGILDLKKTGTDVCVWILIWCFSVNINVFFYVPFVNNESEAKDEN